MTFHIEEKPDQTLQLTFPDRLDNHSVAELWGKCLSILKEKQPHSLILELKHINYCDGAGIALLQVLKKYQTEKNFSCTLSNLKPEFQKLFDYFQQPKEKVLPSETEIGKRKDIFSFLLEYLADFRSSVIFLGQLSVQLFLALRHPKSIRWIDLWRIIEDTGPRALPIIVLIGFLIGLISTFQAAPSFGQFGVQIFLVNLVALGLVREMGPLMTAVLLAGRTASSFSAELGTMKINQEIDALLTMGLNPIRFLVVPRILATALMTPFLEAFFVAAGLFGAFVVMRSLGFPMDALTHQLTSSMKYHDWIGGLIKVFIFGCVIAGIGCEEGLKTRFGAQAVGRSTTRAVVNSLIMLVIVDGVFASLYYVLKV